MSVVWKVIASVAFALLAFACGDTPHAYVVVDNQYASSSTTPLVVYRAFWQAVAFQNPIPPGSSSDPQDTFPASGNTAYVVLAPGWDPTRATLPTSFIIMQSRKDFALSLNSTLRIPVSDSTFIGNCAAGSFLTQAQADVVTQLVFPTDFANLRYDASTCTTTQTRDAGAN